jgi:hypothetical protein
VIESMSTKTNALEIVETAIDDTVARWMDLKITPEDESEYGIQADLPYLKGFACHCKLGADTGKDWPPHTNSFV